MKKTQTLALFYAFVLAVFTASSSTALQVGFYKGKCGTRDVESIVSSIVQSRFSRDPTLVAALLRMQFHDCFVNGCDASLLLDGPSSEKNAGPNASVRGYEVIDAIKSALESACRGVVSCADIIVMATRDAVALARGGRYNVQTGRLDGRVSRASDVNLPSPAISVAQAAAVFASKGLTASDLSILLGGHTVGVTHCPLFQDRLYNFRGTGRPDPTMNSVLLRSLRQRCPQSSSSNNAISLDQNPSSTLIVDNSFYKQIRAGRGVLQIDQELALDWRTSGTVAFMANSTQFNARFGAAMVKLGALQNKVGEIRTNCRAVNKVQPRSPPPRMTPSPPPPRKAPPPPPIRKPPPPPPTKAPRPPTKAPLPPPPPFVSKAPPPPPPPFVSKAPPPPPPPFVSKAPPPPPPPFVFKAPPPPPPSNATGLVPPAA